MFAGKLYYNDLKEVAVSIEELKRFEQFEEDMLWINQHFESLKVRYPDEFIVVYRGEVIAHGPDHSEVIAQAQNTAAIDSSEVALKSIPGGELAVVL